MEGRLQTGEGKGRRKKKQTAANSPCAEVEITKKKGGEREAWQKPKRCYTTEKLGQGNPTCDQKRCAFKWTSREGGK